MLRSYFAAAVAAIAMTAASTVAADASSTVNWVGPTKSEPTDTACYRKTYVGDKCPVGYVYDNLGTCWTQCPLEYPVPCGMECLPQGGDCKLEIIAKVSSVANVALNVATVGVFGELSKASQGVQQTVRCGQKLFNMVNKVVGYAQELRVQFPATTQEQIQYMLARSPIVLTDLPIAVSTCMGVTPGCGGGGGQQQVSDAVGKIVDQAAKKGGSLFTLDNFMNFLKTIGFGPLVSAFTSGDLNQLRQLVTMSPQCGMQIYHIVDVIVDQIQTIKTNAPNSTAADIRFALATTKIFLVDIPDVTAACTKQDDPDKFATRDQIRKTLITIIDRVIAITEVEQGPISTRDYILKITDMALDVIAMFDPTGIAAMAEEYIQPICGPTIFHGEIDDGDATNALGLAVDGEAFAGTAGTWTKQGDGVARITFTSSDTKDVKISVHSAGMDIGSVPVKAGQTVVWTTTIAALQDKTLYLDRWRPGFFGIPGSGGGSLVTWVSRSSAGGHLELSVKINAS